MLWLIFAALIVAFGGALAGPLLRRARPPEHSKTEDSAILKARLDEIARDEAAGLIAVDEAAEAVVEAKRAAIAASPPALAASNTRRTRFMALAVIGAAPLAALWIYFAVGAPDYRRLAAETAAPAPPSVEAIAGLPPGDRKAMIEGMVEGLAAELAEDPENVDGWRMLARSYGVMNRPADSAAAYRELFERTDGDAEDLRGFASALVAMGPDRGRPGELDEVMGKLRAANPDDPLALYYLGSAARERGDRAAAIEHWRRLLEILPPQAPVRPAIEDLIAEASRPAPAEEADGAREDGATP